MYNAAILPSLLNATAANARQEADKSTIAPYTKEMPGRNSWSSSALDGCDSVSLEAPFASYHLDQLRWTEWTTQDVQKQ